MLNRDELVKLVSNIMNFTAPTEEEADKEIELFRDSVPHPGATNLIFYHDQEFDHEPTAEEIVDKALSYKPFEV